MATWRRRAALGGGSAALPAVSVTATLECAGNGRAFFDPPVAGIQWRKGAVGTSRWTGARLRDVIAAGRRAAARHARVDDRRAIGRSARSRRSCARCRGPRRWTPTRSSPTRWTASRFRLLHGAPLARIVPGWEGAYR